MYICIQLHLLLSIFYFHFTHTSAYTHIIPNSFLYILLIGFILARQIRSTKINQYLRPISEFSLNISLMAPCKSILEPSLCDTITSSKPVPPDIRNQPNLHVTRHDLQDYIHTLHFTEWYHQLLLTPSFNYFPSPLTIYITPIPSLLVYLDIHHNYFTFQIFV